MRETGEEFRQGKIALPQQVAEVSSPSQESGAQSQVSSSAGGHN
jgi:hypothetical protein